jgi:hypothetical protein
MVQRRSGTGLMKQPVPRGLVSDLVAEDFEGDGALQSGIEGTVDDAHAAHAERRENLV